LDVEKHWQGESDYPRDYHEDRQVEQAEFQAIGNFFLCQHLQEHLVAAL